MPTVTPAAAAPPLKHYDYVFLADSEWDNETMRQVALDWFNKHPDCEFVLVYEHAGWELGFRRDLTCWASANDCARITGPRPTGHCRTSYRRTEADAKALAESLALVAAGTDLPYGGT